MSKTPMEGLQEARKRAGLSRAELASQIGVEPHTVFRYENGDRHPDVEILVALAKILDCTIDDLLGNPTAAPARRRRMTGASQPSAG